MKKNIIIPMVLVIICALIAFVLIQNSGFGKLNSLLNKNNIITAQDFVTGATIEIYPSVINTNYTNITENGTLYRYNDNGYNIVDKEKFTYIDSVKLQEEQITQIINDIEKLETLTYDMLIIESENNSKEEQEYTKITYDKNEIIVYRSEFEKIINKYLEK